MEYRTALASRIWVMAYNFRRIKFVNLVKSLLHNTGVVIVGFGVAYLGAAIDSLLGLIGFKSHITTTSGWLILIIGFLLRVWATFHFYERQMKVISLVPQKKLITSGPYRFSRNPLYLGGNVFIFLGAALFIGSPIAVVLTVINILVVDIWIRREERQLERNFREEWVRYKSQVRRWF